MARLLMVATVPNTLAAFLLPYARHFREQGWTVDAATADNKIPDSVFSGFDRVHAMRWSRHPLRRGNAHAVVHARAIVRDGEYDIVHTHTPVASFVMRAAVGSLPARARPFVVYTAHGFHFHPRGTTAANGLFRSAERLAGRWTDRLVVINDTDFAAAQRYAIVPPGAVVQMPGIGVDLEYNQPSPALWRAAIEARRAIGVSPEAVVFTMMAELNSNKNHSAVLRALARHPRDDQHLVLLGAGPLRSQLEQEAEQHGISARVHFLGRVPDVRPWILASRATILVSYREGLSRAVLESLSMGVPVVGARTRGITEIVGADGGVIVDPDDVEGITCALDTVQSFPSPPQLREQLLPRLRAYSIERLIDEHERLYAGMLQARVLSGAGSR